jgi:hypothetical protein
VIDALATTTNHDSSGGDAGTGGAAAGGGSVSAVAYYGFNEGNGSIVHDDSGHGHDGKLLGGTWIDGRFGNAVRFDAPAAGPDSGVLVDPFPSPAKDWSVSAWLLVESSELTDNATILSTEMRFAGGWQLNLKPKDATLGSLEFAFWVGDKYATATCDCVVLGTWTHVVAIVDGSAHTIQLIQDGVAAAPAAVMGEFLPGNPYLYMARWSDTGRLLTGALDEVAVFDRALSPSDVASLYKGGLP